MDIRIDKNMPELKHHKKHSSKGIKAHSSKMASKSSLVTNHVAPAEFHMSDNGKHVFG